MLPLKASSNEQRSILFSVGKSTSLNFAQVNS